MRPAGRAYRFLSQLRPSALASYVFDIDGVLIRGGSVLEAGVRALSLLHNGDRWTHPVAFLTNGGGVTEAHRARVLSEKLGYPVEPDMVVLSHTPLRTLSYRYNAMDGAIVTVGERCAHVASEYGFQRVVDIAQLSCRVSTPFSRDVEAGFHVDHISAVFVMADSLDWGRDIQLMCDIVSSTGDRHKLADNEEQPVDLYFSNSDIVFPNEHHRPRLAGGSFRIALEAVYACLYPNRRLVYTQLGKPEMPNYEAAEYVLRSRANELGFGYNIPGAVYAIGDNPRSDVRGANRRGRPWISILVRTGSFDGVHNDPEDPAEIVVDNAYEAVRQTINAS